MFYYNMHSRTKVLFPDTMRLGYGCDTQVAPEDGGPRNEGRSDLDRIAVPARG